MQVSTYNSHEFFEKFSNGTDLQIKAPPLQPVMIALAVAYSVVFLAGTMANFWTACVIGRVLLERENEAPRNVQIYIFALCCCDLVILASLLLLLSDVFAGYWIVGSAFLCYMFLFSETLNKFFGPFVLTALSATCYVSICRSTPSSSKNRDAMVACITVAVCVVISVCLLAPVYMYGDVYYLVIHNESHMEFYLPKCMFEPPDTVFNVFTIYSFILGYAIPALSFTLFYGAVLLFLHRHTRTVSHSNASYFWKVAKTALGLVLFYLICWTPYWAMNMYNFFTPQLNTSGTNFVAILSYVIHLLPYINCAGYPILYTLLNGNIKKAYERAKGRRGGNKSCSSFRSWFSVFFQATKPAKSGSTTTLNSTTLITYNTSSTCLDSALLAKHRDTEVNQFGNTYLKRIEPNKAVMDRSLFSKSSGSVSGNE